MSLLVLACGTIHAGNVVTDWNTIASTTIVTNGGKSPAASSVWFAYSSLAVYDAVNAITGQYQPFYYRVRRSGQRVHRRGSSRGRAPRAGQLFPVATDGAGQPIYNVA